MIFDCHALHHTAMHCNALQHTWCALCNKVQHTATHCNTLQHTATHFTHYNTLQHTATHCNTRLARATLQGLLTSKLTFECNTHCNTRQHPCCTSMRETHAFLRGKQCGTNNGDNGALCVVNTGGYAKNAEIAPIGSTQVFLSPYYLIYIHACISQLTCSDIFLHFH